MPQRHDVPETHNLVSARNAEALSEQERQDLDAAAKGYDAAAGGLPDDGPVPTPPRRDEMQAGAPGVDSSGGTQHQRPPAERDTQGQAGARQPKSDATPQSDSARKNAQSHGLVPGPEEDGVPLDGQRPT